jgi:hypothetical protein
MRTFPTIPTLQPPTAVTQLTKLHSRRPKPNFALYDSNPNAKCHVAITRPCQHLHRSQRRRNTSPRAVCPLSYCPHTRPCPPQLPLPSATHLSTICPQARTLMAAGIRLACIVMWQRAQSSQTNSGSYSVLWVTRTNHRVRSCIRKTMGMAEEPTKRI